MLLLIFEIGGNRYSIRARDIIEIIPLVSLLKVPQAPEYFPGLLNYRGSVIPALDLGLLLGNGPHHRKMSTRIVLMSYPARGGDITIGFILDNIIGAMRAMNAAGTGVDLISNQILGSGGPGDGDKIITRFLPSRVIPSSLINDILRLYSEENAETNG